MAALPTIDRQHSDGRLPGQGLPAPRTTPRVPVGPLRRILVVEDHDHTNRWLTRHLRLEEYDVTPVQRADHAWKLFCATVGGGQSGRVRRFDAVILDLGLPDRSGMELIGQFLALDPKIAVIVLTSRTDGDSHATAIDRGAATFLTKPCDFKVITAHLKRSFVEAQTARTQQQAPPPGEKRIALFGDRLIIDQQTKSVTVNGEVVPLTPAERDLLTHLASRPTRVLSGRELLEAHWGPYANLHSVHETIRRIRKKTGVSGLIEHRPNAGYRLNGAALGYQSDKRTPAP